MEVLNILRMVKLFGWERKMSERLAEKREEELYWIQKGNLVEIVSATVKYDPSYEVVCGLTSHLLKASSYQLRRSLQHTQLSESLIFSHESRLTLPQV